jgi:hypothetical protein
MNFAVLNGHQLTSAARPMLSLIPTMAVANSFYVLLRSGQEAAVKRPVVACPACATRDCDKERGIDVG